MEPKYILEPRAQQKQTPPGKTHLTHAARHLALRALCLLGLGATLSACPSSPDYGDDKNALRGVRTVSFDKNGGDTEAVPASITLRPQETTVERLPAPPTRAGRTFLGWNTEKDGSGSPFTAQTPVTADILLIVYAQWDAPSSPAAQLGIRLQRNTLTFTPMKDGTYDERSPVFTVTVSGFKNEADADRVMLEVSTTGNNPPWFWWQQQDSFSEGTKTFTFSFAYLKTDFDEAPATLRFNPRNIPAGYEYSDGAHTLRVATANGKKDGRPIPVHQGNIGHFNRYADTNDGLKLHYQLVENVELTPPEAGKSNWKAIGDATVAGRFVGSFDGGGHIIANLTIHAPDDTAQNDYQGMFGYIGSGAEIKNLGLEGGSITGRSFVGSLVGRNDGAVYKSYATGSVKGSGNVVGGLIGDNAGGRVQNSYATGSVTGGGYLGGLVGRNNEGTVQNSYATGSVKGSGNVVGGLVGTGTNGGKVENSYATGSVNGNNVVGGLAGSNYSNYAKVAMQNSVALNPSVVATTTATESYVGRVAGSNGSGDLLDNYARNNMKLEGGGKPYEPTEDTAQADMKDGAGTSAFNTLSFWTTTLSSWDFSEDGDWEWREGFLPILRGVGGKQEPVVKDVP